jgi:hypothetical protein
MKVFKIFTALFVFSLSSFAYDTPDIRFEIEPLANSRLSVKVFEKRNIIFGQTVDSNLKAPLQSLYCKLQKVQDPKGQDVFVLSYKGRDQSALSLLLYKNGDITIPSATNTNYQEKKTWGFGTKGKLINQSSAAFYKAFTNVQAFHNYGIFKAFSGHYKQKYLFNKGVIHLGDEGAFAGADAYVDYFPLIDKEAKPNYQKGIIDDYGVIIAEDGLKISGLTHHAHGLTDIHKELILENASIENHQNYNVSGPIRGTANR